MRPSGRITAAILQNAGIGRARPDRGPAGPQPSSPHSSSANTEVSKCSPAATASGPVLPAKPANLPRSPRKSSLRGEALDALRAHGVDVDAPGDLAALGGYPDAVVVVDRGRWSVRLPQPGLSRAALAEAGWFDPDSGTLTVYAAPLAEALTVLLRRHGVRPLLVTWGAPPEEVERHNARAAFAPGTVSPVSRSSRVTDAVRRLVPEPHRRWLHARPGGGT
ncbi:hypothetical protein ACWEOA_16675, partial [Streptomyces sp. NPDC004457]